MKTLQNNYTTPWQSKRLLELGVPADSADCYYVTSVGKKPNIIHSEFHFDVKCKSTPKPCWSVGRLIEIFEICTQTKFKRVQQTDNLVYLTPLEDVLMQIEHNACGFYDNTKWDTNLLNG